MKTLLHYRTWLWAALQSFGPWGVFLTAGVDGAGIPLPGAVDLVLVSYVYQDPRRAWLFVLLASCGSALGCLVMYVVGYFGGEVLIEHRMPAWKFQKIRSDFDQHPFLTVALPCMLPPPFPLKLVILSAGAFEMRWPLFLVAIFAGRLVRFGAFAVLTLKFGPGILRVFNTAVLHHPLITLLVIVAAAVIFVLVHRLRGKVPVSSF